MISSNPMGLTSRLVLCSFVRRRRRAWGAMKWQRSKHFARAKSNPARSSLESNRRCARCGRAFLGRTTLLERRIMSSARASSGARASSAAAAATRRPLALVLCAAALATVALAATSIPAVAAEAHHAMVVAENALAASAGVEILSRGGNAIDAAAATSLAVGVTNPASCGIGGGGFMLIYLARPHSFSALDYRERAPMAASATMYVRNGKPNEELAQSGPLAGAGPGEMGGGAPLRE